MDDPFAQLVTVGLLAAALAVLAWAGDRRRMLRRDPDAVGIMPWTALFFWALLVACVALALAVRLWLAGYRP
jgi:hypothetical protein